jgi:GT2 family glycosyltransferase
VLFAPSVLPPLGPDVAQDPRRYSDWVRRREAERLRQTNSGDGPDLRVLMVLAGAPRARTAATLRGLRAQLTDRWSLTIVASEPELGQLRRLMRTAVPRRTRRRMRVVVGPPDAPANELLQIGLADVRGSAAALIFPGDVWAPDAVTLLAPALPPAGVAYADEDRVTPEGHHVDPRLKPQFSPDFLSCSAYVGRPIAVGSVLTSEVPRLSSTDARAVEREFAEWACRHAANVVHVPEVLCHRTDEAAPSVMSQTATTPRTTSPPQGHAPVSIIVPFRDQPRFLRTCLDSVRATSEENPEFVLVDNGSCEPETATLLARVGALPAVKVITDSGPFNWARLSNAGARLATGKVLLFLNNDIEAFRPGWISTLVADVLREDVGVVGARLLYPDRRVQHCGMVVGLNGAAGHPLVGLPESEPGYLGMARLRRECSAVTGACLATRREVFEQLGGFDESLGVDLNDVDFCLRSGAAGYRVLYAPEAELIHHESPSRGTAGATGDIVRFVDRWAEYIAAGDPYFSRHLTRADPSCALADPDEKERWNRWFSELASR